MSWAGRTLSDGARSFYKAEEAVWEARFQNFFERASPDALPAMDVSHFHDIQPAAWEAEAAAT
ncbi:MAG: hypothetical protein V3R89_00280 [Thermoanaerobaculia bacterium]